MQRSWLWLCFLSCASCMEFTPFTSSEHYKCGAFLKGRAQDRALGIYYQSINKLVKSISNPFPHQELLNRQALTGDVNEIQSSLETKYWQWGKWQEGWLILAGIVLVIEVVFPVLYLLYRLCMCCFSGKAKKQTTDQRYDGCKRSCLNVFVAVLVVVDVFAAAALLVTSQYAHIGLEELPSRLNHCVDDLNLYKRDTDMRIRKLLIDDYQTLNETISLQLSQAGHHVVDRVKRLTGAHAIDVFLNVSQSAKEVQIALKDISSQLENLNEEGSRFEVEFSRLRKTAGSEIASCIENEIDPLKSICHRADRLLENLASSRFRVDKGVLSSSTLETLQQILDANITELFDGSNAQFQAVESRLQHEIDQKTFGAQDVLRRIGDDMFVIAETISTKIRQVNFDFFYNIIAKVSDKKQSKAMTYVQYGWYVSLAMNAVFILLAFCFLLGLIYGMCGRRPTFYNDDCCVRTTGAKFFSCGIWFGLLLFTVLCVFTVVMLLVVGNASSLVCHPLRDPLGRPDILSLLNRYIEIYRSNKKNSELNSLFEKKSPADIIRACRRNETFYEIFQFDEKYHLNKLKDFQKDSYEQLEEFLEQSLAELPVIRPLEAIVSETELKNLEKLGTVNITHISQDALERIQHTIDELDVMAKLQTFEQQMDVSGRPRAVGSVMEQLEQIDLTIARPLRLRLEALHRNLTVLDKRLSEVEVPISSLLGKLQHAQALLSADVRPHFEKAAREELNETLIFVDQYIQHVRNQMQHDVSSCTPVTSIARSATAAFCSHTIDPLNGSWMAMLISLLCLAPIIFFTTSLVYLYGKMHSFPKYIVEPPPEHHHMSSFITDTYDTRQKPVYNNYSYSDDHRTYR